MELLLENMAHTLFMYCIICWVACPIILFADKMLGFNLLTITGLEEFVITWVFFPIFSVFAVVYGTILLIGFVLKILFLPIYKLYQLIGKK